MPYTTAFPDFPPSSLPSIPPAWKDTSWHLDGCPSWYTPKGHTVWVDYEDVSMREHHQGARFVVVDHDDEELLATDRWVDVLVMEL